MAKIPSKALEGKRIRLQRTTDAHTKLQPGAEGTVAMVDAVGTVHVDWDSGEKLGLCWDAGDRWTILTTAKPYSY